MPDVQLQQQFPAAPDVSIGRDAAEVDIWLREQFPAAPDLAHYRTIFPYPNAPSGIAASLSLAMAATEAADVAAFSLTVTGGGASLTFALAGTEAADTLAATFVHGHPLSLAATEAADTAAFALTSPITAPTTVEAGGRGSRQRRRHFVEIDGEQFEISGPQEAAALFRQAREVAQEAAPAAVKAAPTAPPPRIALVVQPQAQPPAETHRLQAQIDAANAAIARIYERARQAQALIDQEDEDIAVLLTMGIL